MNKVIVAGSVNMDIVAHAERHPRVGETVFGSDLNFYPGGKGANQAVASAKLGAKTLLAGKVGEDGFASELELFLNQNGVDLALLYKTADAGTGTALIVVGVDGDNTIVVVPGANDLLTADDVTNVPISEGDVLVSQFEIPLSTIISLFRTGKAKGARTILNPAPARQITSELMSLVDVLVLNETELCSLTSQHVAEELDAEIAARLGRRLRARNDQVIIVTLGADGAVAISGDDTIRVKGQKVNVLDTTGAGDCFVGATAAALARGDSLEDALRFANSAASICVQRKGAGPSMPTESEVASTMERAHAA